VAELNQPFGTVYEGATSDRTILDPTDTNDGDIDTESLRQSFAAPSVQLSVWETDLALPYLIATIDLVAGTGAVPTTTSPTTWTVELSTGAGFVAAPITQSNGAIGGRATSTLTLTTPTAARYVRIIHTSPSSGFVSNLYVTTFDINGSVIDDTEEPDGPPYEAPPAAGAIVEIYVPDPDGPRWDVALWDEAEWGADSWQSITHLSVSGEIAWGATSPDRGILATQEAGTLYVDTHDPDRELDPDNPDSPWSGYLLPMLPIRVNHGGNTVRTARVTSIQYSHVKRGGRIMAADAIMVAGNAKVPVGTELADTLGPRMYEAIAAADVDLILESTGGLYDAAIAPLDPDDRVSVWEVISGAATERLAVAWVDRHEHIQVTAWAAATADSLVIDAQMMVDLQSRVSHDGLYSVVRALDADTDLYEEARVIPLPAYGERVYERRVATTDAAAWVAAVLADRRDATIRYIPGVIYPDTAAEVDALIGIRILDTVTVRHEYTDPEVEARVRVLGARVRFRDVSPHPGDVRTEWRWTLMTTLAAALPLVDDDDPESFLVSDDDGDVFLYPDGVTTL
jgi:hypothetical protein